MPSVHKVLLVCVAIALSVLLFAALPSPASARDKDCSDFPTQRAAQTFFLKHGGPRHDPDRLDGDDDGRACEDNPCPCSYRQHLLQRHEMFLNTGRRLPLQI
jgi:Excalibur calcium-binding domain